jgi:hypothetical protein
VSRSRASNRLSFRHLLKGERACSSMQPPQPSGRKLRLLVVSACLFLGFVLIKLPTNAADSTLHRQQLNTTESSAAKPARKGGAVRLADVPAVPVNHKSSGAMKQVIAIAVIVTQRQTAYTSHTSTCSCLVHATMPCLQQHHNTSSFPNIQRLLACCLAV